MKQQKETVSMLLNIDNFYGDYQGRLAPVLKFLVFSSAPILLYVYLSFPVPAWVFWPLEVLFIFRMALLILGKEKERMVHFKSQMNDQYSSVYNMLRIKNIREDGLIEYTNDRVAYMLVCYNGSSTNDVARSKYLKEFVSALSGDFDFDIIIQNIAEVKALEERYRHVQLFAEPEAAKDFLDIIDYNRNLVYESSLITRVVFIVKGNTSDFKAIRKALEAAKTSASSKAFKRVFVADKEAVEDVTGRDINTVVNFEYLLQKKYATHEYLGSKVVGFDDDIVFEAKEQHIDTTGFIPDLED